MYLSKSRVRNKGGDIMLALELCPHEKAHSEIINKQSALQIAQIGTIPYYFCSISTIEAQVLRQNCYSFQRSRSRGNITTKTLAQSASYIDDELTQLTGEKL